MEQKYRDEWVERFKEEAMPKIRESLKPRTVILFGSRVKGRGWQESDIDVLIVSDYFSGKPFLGRMPFMLRLVRFPCPIDFLCYTPEEFEKMKNSSIVIREALREGVDVTSK